MQDLTFLNSIIDFVKSKREHILSYSEKLDILLVQAQVRIENIEAKKKTGKGRKPKTVDPNLRTSFLLKRGKNNVVDVWNEFINVGNVSTSVSIQRPDRVSNLSGNAVIMDVRGFLRVRRIQKIRTVAKDVMLFLYNANFINFDLNDDLQKQAALRKVQRFLNKFGYKRGKRKGKMSLQMAAKLKYKRDKYITYMTNNPERRKIYTDESYIHHNYNRHNDSLFDPSDNSYIEPIPRNKGRRFCFITAIIEKAIDHDSIGDYNDYSKQAHVLMDTLDIFEGGRTKDYHGMFDNKYYIQWMKKLLKALRDENIENCDIIMDNAKYHINLPQSTPKRGDKKAALLEYCNDNNIIVNPQSLKPEIVEKVMSHVQANVRPIIVEMAENSGHRVIFTPPYHSDLEPIELVWAITKGEVIVLYFFLIILK